MGVADVREVPKEGVWEVIRRLWDVVAAAGLLLVALPILIPAAVLLLVSDGRPVFFGHRRIGRGGKAFRCWKLRTMSVDAEERLRGDIELDRLHRENGFKLPAERDPRITPVGRWLRRRYIDEIPQLVNVIGGDLSLVGPRPVVEEELALFGDGVGELLQIRPGIFGAWNSLGTDRPAYPERAQVELDYVRNRGISTDIEILVRSVRSVLQGEPTPCTPRRRPE